MAAAVLVVVAGGSLVAHAAAVSASDAVAPADSGIGDALAALSTSWPQPTAVDHVRVVGTGPRWSGTIDFGDGTSVDLTPGSTGIADTGFATRTVDRAVLTITGSDLRVDSWSIDSAPAATTVSASSNASTDALAALSDGSIERGAAGGQWAAATSDRTPWLRWSFPTIRTLAAVQLLGAAASPTDLHGVLTFSDGSTVAISGVGGATNGPSTVAFAPRAASWVRLDLAQTTPAAAVALREAVIYDSTSTPARWPAAPAAQGSAQPTVASGCSATSAAIGTSTNGPALVCPATGSRVDGTATVVVQVAAGAAVAAATWVPGDTGSGAVRAVATATADASGRAVLQIDTTSLPHGPFALRITAEGSDRALYVQLDNGRGIPVSSSGSAPSGMTLRFDEQFTGPLSASATGAGSEYLSTRPSATGGSDFGGARFLAPESGAGTLATVDSDYLRVRLQPAAGDDPAGWGRTLAGGLISSLRADGSGFSAQDGYFEARMLGAPGTGTWPAFSTQSTEGATSRSATQSEGDAVELYGHDTSTTCRSTHDWAAGDGEPAGDTDCRALSGFTDWALGWHTYGVRISSAATEYYVDGAKVSTQAALRQNAEPFFFMLDLTSDGGWPTDLSPTGGVSDMYVDWVHVYT